MLLDLKPADCLSRCGFEPDVSLSTLAMLTSIEVRLEECLATVAALSLAQVGCTCTAERLPSASAVWAVNCNTQQRNSVLFPTNLTP